MDPTTARSRWKVATGLAVITAAYWVFMFVATHLQADQLPSGVPPALDKLEHLLGFAALAVLLCVLGAWWGYPSGWICLAVLAVIGVYGIADEWTQSLVPTRKPDWRDWLANMTGAALGVAAFVAVRAVAFATRRTRTCPVRSS